MDQPLGSTVSLRVQAVDRLGRSVASVICKGTNNLAMVHTGQAFVYCQDLGRCDRQAYLAAERQAVAQRLGVRVVPGGGLRGPGSSGMGERVVAAQGRLQLPLLQTLSSKPEAAKPSGNKYKCKQIGIGPL